MCPNKSLLCRFIALALALLLIVPLSAACGGGGEEATPAFTATPTSTVTSTATPTTPTHTATPTLTPSGPIKIGAITSWSGTAAISGMHFADAVIKLVEKQVEDMGGILGGRMVQVVKYDNRASVAEAAAGATKLILEDKVSALVFGGVGGAEAKAVSDVAEKEKVLFAAFTAIEGLDELKFTVQAYVSMDGWQGNLSDVATKVVKAKTAAFLWKDYSVGREICSGVRERIKAAGVSVIYEQYVAPGTTDMMPYLTKIKYLNPDVLIMQQDTEQCITMAKQIMELGGWGNIRVDIMENGIFARKMPGAVGWYVLAPWMPGLEYPGAQKFEKDWQEIYSSVPETNHAIYYNCLWTVIEAMKLAGTAEDTEAIGRAARSGTLEWDTPMGRAHFTPEGGSSLRNIVVEVQEGGDIVRVTW